jgi:hypothetical protein
MIEGRAKKCLSPVSCDGMKRQVVVARDPVSTVGNVREPYVVTVVPAARCNKFRGGSIAADCRHFSRLQNSGCKNSGC